MTSASPMVARCLTQVQSDALASTDIASNMYGPQVEAIVLSVLKELTTDTLVAGATQAVILAQIALAAGDAG